MSWTYGLDAGDHGDLVADRFGLNEPSRPGRYDIRCRRCGTPRSRHTTPGLNDGTLHRDHPPGPAPAGWHSPCLYTP